MNLIKPGGLLASYILFSRPDVKNRIELEFHERRVEPHIDEMSTSSDQRCFEDRMTSGCFQERPAIAMMQRR